MSAPFVAHRLAPGRLSKTNRNDWATQLTRAIRRMGKYRRACGVVWEEEKDKKNGSNEQRKRSKKKEEKGRERERERKKKGEEKRGE